MDRLISEQAVFKTIDSLKANFTCYDSVTLDEVYSHVKTIPSAEPNITWVIGADGAKIAFKDVPVWKVTKICEILGEPQERSE